MTDEIRFAKIDDAIQRLASVSADLSKMLAVHDQRLGTQEKTADSILISMEKRRIEIDERFRDLQNELHEQTESIKFNASTQHIEQNQKIESLQKFIWIATGIATTISWLLPNLITKFFR